MTDGTSDNGTDTNWHRTHRRTALKIAGVSCASLAGLSGSAAAHSGNSKSNGNGQGNKNKGAGKGKWCCGCPGGDDKGEGYERDHPHEDDPTRWDDWEPGDGKPPWAGDDDDEEDEDDGDDSDGGSDDDQDQDEDEGEGDDSEAPDGGDGEDGSEDDSEAPDEGEDGDESTPDDGTEDDPDNDDGEDDSDDSDDDSGSEDGDGSDDGDEDDSDDEPADLAAQIEARIHEETNAYRDEQGEDALDYSDDLAAVARGHSEDMLEQDFFDHDSPDGRGPGDRLDEGGVDCNRWGENIAWESGSVSDDDADSIADSIVEGWINSPGHRQNLLGNYAEGGIGVAVSDTEVYATQMFCTPSN